MQCDEALNRLNERIDGELPRDVSAALDEHLAACEGCKLAADALPAVDAELRRAFAERRAAADRLAQRTIAAMQAMPNVELATPSQHGAANRAGWAQLLLAAAIGFLLAVAAFRPWQLRPDAQQASAPQTPAARLALASGAVEVQPSVLPVFMCPVNSDIEPDSVVRTGPEVQCELSLGGSGTLRLDCNTEVTLRPDKVIEVNRGRIWSCNQSTATPLSVQVAGCQIVAKPAAAFAINCQSEASRLAVVDGAVVVAAGKQSQEVTAGQQMRIADGQVEREPYPQDIVLETAWVNRLLALGGPGHPELDERVNQLLASIGAAKLSLLYEDELRALGSSGVPPLLAYLDSTRGTPDLKDRVAAARIVADVAQPASIGDLIVLLTDANGDVRFHAARGLLRLTSRDQGRTPEQWKAGPWNECTAAYDAWLAWWHENRDRYPAARQHVPAVNAPPF